jgi:antagonist of KipI
MSALSVIAPGLLTTVQDLGRWGFQSSGVPVAGPMDIYAHRAANSLVRNAHDCATLEVTLTGPELESDAGCVVAVSGAEFELTAGGQRVGMHALVALPPRGRLKFGRRVRGTRAYLAVEGGIDVPRVLGSRATHLASAMGGFEGRALRAGDRLPVGAPQRRGAASTARGREDRAAGESPDLPRGHARVRILPGPHHRSFGVDALATLQSSSYVIDPRSDRMGFRLEGAPLVPADPTEMISDAVPMGAIQVPASGRPILLMADRQTTGGYRTIATVITADLGVAGQLAPGETISFALCSRAEAMAALIARERRLLGVLRTEPS